MFIEAGIIIGIHGENPPLMKTKKKLFNEGWQKTNIKR